MKLNKLNLIYIQLNATATVQYWQADKFSWTVTYRDDVAEEERKIIEKLW